MTVLSSHHQHPSYHSDHNFLKFSSLSNTNYLPIIYQWFHIFVIESLYLGYSLMVKVIMVRLAVTIIVCSVENGAGFENDAHWIWMDVNLY